MPICWVFHAVNPFMKLIIVVRGGLGSYILDSVILSLNLKGKVRKLYSSEHNIKSYTEKNRRVCRWLNHKLVLNYLKIYLP